LRFLLNSLKDVLSGGANSLVKESPALYYSLGNLADNKRQWDNAITYYRRALALDSQYVDAYIGLGGDYYEKAQYGLEVENYLKATLADPQSRDAFIY